ncbi:hypothetical protein NKG05_16710 [Oerskovia sp. M15]
MSSPSTSTRSRVSRAVWSRRLRRRVRRVRRRPGLPKQVQVLVRSVRVVSVAGSQVKVDEESDTGQQNVIPVTLALQPNDALAVTYAAAFAQEVRLVGLPTGSAEDRTGELDDLDAGDLGGTAIPEGDR